MLTINSFLGRIIFVKREKLIKTLIVEYEKKIEAVFMDIHQEHWPIILIRLRVAR